MTLQWMRTSNAMQASHIRQIEMTLQWMQSRAAVAVDAHPLQCRPRTLDIRAPRSTLGTVAAAVVAVAMRETNT